MAANSLFSSTFRVTLENVSNLKIDFLRLTFDDSTIAPSQQSLAEGVLSVFETYETEYDLIRRPVFTWDSKRHPQEIVPGQKVVLSVRCYGKVGWYVYTCSFTFLKCRVTPSSALAG